jgi:hypothetical protein
MITEIDNKASEKETCKQKSKIKVYNIINCNIEKFMKTNNIIKGQHNDSGILKNWENYSKQ